MNQNQNQSNEGGRHDEDASLSEFLTSLMDYTPTIPDELVEHYLGKSGFQSPDVRLIRLVAVATQKFISEVATDALQQCKARQASVVKDKRDKQQKDKRLVLTMEDLSKALSEYGVNVKHQEYFADSPSTGMEPPTKDDRVTNIYLLFHLLVFIFLEFSLTHDNFFHLCIDCVDQLSFLTNVKIVVYLSMYIALIF